MRKGVKGFGEVIWEVNVEFMEEEKVGLSPHSPRTIGFMSEKVK